MVFFPFGLFDAQSHVIELPTHPQYCRHLYHVLAKSKFVGDHGNCNSEHPSASIVQKYDGDENDAYKNGQ